MNSPAPGSPLHVLLIEPDFRTREDAGVTRTYDFARHLAQNGHRVSILAAKAKREKTALDPGIALKTIGGPAPAFGKTHTRGFARNFAGAAMFGIWDIKDVDAVVTTDRPIRLLPLTAFFALWRGVPMILDVMHGAPKAAPMAASFRQKCQRVMERAFYRMGTAAATRITTVTPALKDDLTAEGIAEAKVAVCLLGCDTHTQAPDELPARIAQLLPDGGQRPYVVFAGTMPQGRNLGRILDIAREMKDEPLSFLFCGDGPARAQLEARAASMGLLGTSAIFTGAVSRRELQAVLRFSIAALADCAPDARGGFLLDALAAAKPVILLGHGWQRDLVEGRGAGVSLPIDAPADAAKELADFLTDGDGLRRAGQQAAALAAGRFNLDRVGAEFRNLVQDTIAADPREAVMRRRTLRAKRALDIALSLAGLIVLSPVFLLLAIAIWMRMGGPVFFTQQRTGLHGRFFKIIKFRTMTSGKGADGKLLDDAARLTPLGKFLRRTSLDELPELLNVLAGDMSLVGPRPLLPEYLPYYDAEQRRRHELKPGLTGWAQVNGRNAVSWEERFTLDVWYVDHVSFGLDLKILAKTVWVALSGSGVSAGDHATMPRFDEVMAKRQGAEDV
jgi:lipopolysaccharide/colanic/teichoic acid biosynthesis glycosyltransferase/glycosyltransferase involved in cell wall biosynthesis